MPILKCPYCDDEDIEISYNHKRRQYTLTCFNCDNYIKINARQTDLKCSECESNNIVHDDYESYCLDCGLVLSATSNYVAGFKIVLDWGLIL